MRSNIFKKLCIVAFCLCLVPVVHASENIDLSDPNNWQFFGTVSPGQVGFLLGDHDGYTEGDSCWAKWTGQAYDYDVAVSKIAFKPPFTFKFRAAFDPTESGYNMIGVACLRDDITTKDFFTCTDKAPFIGTGVAAGTRWEEPNQVCDGSPHSKASYECVSVNDRFNDYEITVNEDGTYEIKVNGQHLHSGEVKCESGWYVATAQAFDSQVDFLEGSVTSGEYASVERIIASSEETEENETEISENEPETEIENATEATCEEKVKAAWQEGFEAGKKFCMEHPEECGITQGTSTQEECQETTTENNTLQACTPSFDFATFSLNIPCLRLGDKNYDVKLGIIQVRPQILLQVLSIKESQNQE